MESSEMPPLERRCGRCHISKPLADFEKARTRRYGISSRCRECKRELDRARKRKLVASGRDAELARARYRNDPDVRQRSKAKRRRQMERPEHKVREAARMRERRSCESEREKMRARSAVATAIAAGRLVRLPCACGETRTEGHHFLGYARENWLKVKWLCRSCHNREHGRAA